MDITLYYAPVTCALAPYVSLTEAGADFKTNLVNLRKKQQMSAEYLAINPKHKVPALVVDGAVLTENVAINTWIAATYPDAKLFPEDPWQQVQAMSLHAWISGGIHPNLARINSPQKITDLAGAEGSVKRLAAETVIENFQIAEEQLEGRDYFFDHFTTVDAHFFWAFRRATQFDLALQDLTNCQAHFARMQERDSVKKVLNFEKDVQAQFAAAS